MGRIVDEFSTAFRDFATDGVASSGPHEPIKSEIRAIGGVIEEVITEEVGTLEELVDSTLTSGRRGYLTWSAMAADTGQPAGTLGEVSPADSGTHTDPVVGGTVANSGVFRYSSSPAGWQRLYAMPVSATASNAETLTGTDTAKAVTPAGLKYVRDQVLGTDDGGGTIFTRLGEAEDQLDLNRQALINLGAAQTQDPSSYATAGYLHAPSYSNPATRRTITRGASTITIAVTLQQSWLFTFEDRDVAGGRIFRAEFTATASASSTYGFGIGITTEAKADAARGDATDLTVWESGSAGTVTTRAFVMRNNGVAQCVTNQTIGSGNTLDQSTIKSNQANGTTFTTGDKIRAEARVPDDAVSDRQIDWWKQTGGAGAWLYMGFITVAAADWPLTSEPCAAGHSNSTLSATIHERSVRAIDAGETGTVTAPETTIRYVNPGASSGGTGDRSLPVQSILDVATSITQSSNRLKIVLKGGIHRITSTFSLAHDAYQDVEICSASGEMAEIRGTRAAGTWTQDGSNPTVWWVPNYYGGSLSSANGHVVSYDPRALDWDASFAQWAEVRALKSLGNNVAPATMAAETVPGCSLNTSNGRMYIVLPGGENPNSVGSLELVQVDRVLNLAGPSSGALMFRPRAILENFKMAGGITNVMRASVWSLLSDNVLTGGAVSDVAEFRECSGQMHRFRAMGAHNDCVKTNLYDPTGGTTPRYSDVDRPLLEFIDPEFHGALIGDNISNHQDGGDVSLRGGRLYSAGKHNMSMISSFAVSGTRMGLGAQGGMMVAFAEDGIARINDAFVEDSLYGLTLSKGAATTHMVRMLVDGLVVSTPLGLTTRGIYLFNSAAANTVEMDLSRYLCDTAIPSGDRRVGFSGSTVRERTYA